MGSHSSHGGHERWSDSNYILKVETIGFIDELDMGCDTLRNLGQLWVWPL